MHFINSRLIRKFKWFFLRFYACFVIFLALLYFCLMLNFNSGLQRLIAGEDRHLVIISATYYRKSNIYAENRLVLLMNGPARFDSPPSLYAQTINGNNEVVGSSLNMFNTFSPTIECRWTSYMAQFESVEEPQRLLISDSRWRTGIEIPIRLPFSERKVYMGACFSPLFYMENWQLLITSLELYRHFGAELLVLYVQSALKEIMDIFKIYSSIVELEPWYSIKLSDSAKNSIGYDPNAELDWRNQATAHTDCLLKYRNAADFLVVGDIDDIILSNIEKSFLPELQLLNANHLKASAFSFIRFGATTETDSNATQFSLRKTLMSIQVDTFQPDDPKYIANTAKVESLWIHNPGVVAPHTIIKSVPVKRGRMIHLRGWKFGGQKQQEHDEKAKKGNHSIWRSLPLFNELIPDPKAIETIDRAFWRTWKRHRTILKNLPSKQIYGKKFVECYDRIFYSVDKQVTECPGPIRCKIEPISGMECANGVREFVGHFFSTGIHLYFARSEPNFVYSNDGCSL